MEDVLGGLGFSSKETAIYKYLLENGRRSAAEVAHACSEKRANTYVLLEGLIDKGVIIASDEQAVRSFTATHPSSLQKLLKAEQERQAQLSAALTAVMPQLTSRFALGSDKPGVVHMQGADGFLTLLEDMTRSSTEVLLVASNKTPSDPATLKQFRELLLKRKRAGVSTRAIFHHNATESEFTRIFAERGMDLRFLGDQQFTGELVIYEDNVVFTVYEPSLIVTIITNQAIAATMRQLFEQLWEKSEARKC